MLGKRPPERTGPTYSKPVTNENWDTELLEFLADSTDENEPQWSSILMRVRTERGRDRCSVLETYDLTIPKMEEVAEQYGPGRYRVNVRYVDKDTGKWRANSRGFEIDPDFGRGRRAGGVAGAAQPPAASGGGDTALLQYMMQQQQQQAQNMLGMFSAMAQAMSGKDGGGGLEAFQKQMQKMLMASFDSQMSMMQRVITARMPAEIAAADEEQDDGEGAETFVESAIQILSQLWQRYGKQMLAHPREGAQQVAADVAKLPQVQYCLSHPDEYDQLYTRFLQETSAPQDKLDTFIRELGYPTPDELKAEINKQQEGEG